MFSTFSSLSNDYICLLTYSITDWQAYVEALREEKLRALGVLLDDEPTSAVSGGRGQTPLVREFLYLVILTDF